MAFLSCPRCTESGYQIFVTHAYCVGCNYSPDFDPGTKPKRLRTNKLNTLPTWARRDRCVGSVMPL